MVRIRLKRMGRRHRPFYRMNAVEKRTQRDGRVIEPLGWYDPMAKDADKQLKIDAERIRFWLDRGAQPSDTVKDILAKEGIIDADKWKAERESRVNKRKKTIVEQKEAEATAKKAEEEAAAKAAAEEAEAAKKKAEEEAAAAKAAEAESATEEAPAEEEAKADES